jgi:hypothetical protein
MFPEVYLVLLADDFWLGNRRRLAFRPRRRLVNVRMAAERCTLCD